jgi:hypothetical protein
MKKRKAKKKKDVKTIVVLAPTGLIKCKATKMPGGKLVMDDPTYEKKIYKMVEKQSNC